MRVYLPLMKEDLPFEALSRRDFLRYFLTVPAALLLPPIPELRLAWEIPDTEKRMSLLADPDFFTQLRGFSRRMLLTGQGDVDQYKRLDPQYLESFTDYNYPSHACTEASIATILKTLAYFKNGKVPDITIADIINYLMEKKYEGNDIIKENDIGMFDDQFEWAVEAMKSFGKETDLYTYVEPIPEWGFGENHIIPTSKWGELFEAARETMIDTGNLLIAKVFKYCDPKGTAPHMVLFSSLDADNPLVVDPWGPDKLGDVRSRKLTDFVEKSATGFTGIDPGQYGFLALAGVIANF